MKLYRILKFSNVLKMNNIYNILKPLSTINKLYKMGMCSSNDRNIAIKIDKPEVKHSVDQAKSAKSDKSDDEFETDNDTDCEMDDHRSNNKSVDKKTNDIDIKNKNGTKIRGRSRIKTKSDGSKIRSKSETEPKTKSNIRTKPNTRFNADIISENDSECIEIKSEEKELDFVKIRRKKYKRRTNERSPSIKYIKKSIPPNLRQSVWMEHFKDSIHGVCYCCQKEITSFQFECGHIIAEFHGGETKIHNLKPVCKSCNRSMGVMNMEVYKKKYYE